MPENAKPRFSSNIDTGRLAVLVVLLALVGGGFYFSNQKTNDVQSGVDAKAIDLNAFLVGQCKRDEFRDAIIIQALRDAQRRAERSLKNEIERAYEVQRIQISINKIEQQKDDCRNSLPKVS